MPWNSYYQITRSKEEGKIKLDALSTGGIAMCENAGLGGFVFALILRVYFHDLLSPSICSGSLQLPLRMKERYKLLIGSRDYKGLPWR